MKLSCLQENLAQGLNTVKRAVAHRSTLPVLSNVLLATDNGRLRLAATNLEIGINCWIEAQVEEEGAMTVPAVAFADLVNMLPPEQIDLELVEQTETLKLQCQKTKSSFKGISATEFPNIPIAGNDIVTIDADLFREMVGQVSIAAAKDESRPILTGILMRFEQDKLTMAAADGFRLSARSVKLEGNSEGGSLVVPHVALEEAAKLKVMGMDLRNNQVIFQSDNSNLVSQLIEGNFPDYEQIIPKEFKTRITLDTQVFLLACKKAEVFAKEAANLITLEIIPEGNIIISAQSAELGDSQDIIEATVMGEPIIINLNVKYLMEALQVIPTGNSILGMNGLVEPILLQPDDPEIDLQIVIMPMH